MVKLSLLANDMITYIENPEDSTKNYYQIGKEVVELSLLTDDMRMYVGILVQPVSRDAFETLSRPNSNCFTWREKGEATLCRERVLLTSLPTGLLFAFLMHLVILIHHKSSPTFGKEVFSTKTYIVCENREQ